MNPLNIPDWNELVLEHKDYSFFHSKEWAKVLIDSYNYIPNYILINFNDKSGGIIPFMFVKSWLTGKRAVSLPFSDFCEPLFMTGFPSNDLIESVINSCKDGGMKSAEFRVSWKDFPFETKEFRTDFRHVLKLDKTEADLLKSFSENTKRNIKKAAKEKLTLKIHTDYNGVKIFYEMNCETRKKHGLPPQPFHFFENLYKSVIAKGMGEIICAVKDDLYIAGAVYLKFGKKLLYKYGASYARYYESRGNNFVMWEAIKKYLSEGFEEFDFGRTENENEGLRRFKLGWSAEEMFIYTTRYDIEKKEFLSSSTKTKGIHNSIFYHSPIFISKLVGNKLYKHIG